jgi:3-oxoacyl-[acyl-carrier protein] reductase
MRESKNILISGATRGIGRSLAEHYLEQGHRVIGIGRNNSTIEHPGYSHFAADVSKEATIRPVFQAVRVRFGHLDAAINCAGVASMNHAILTPMTSVAHILDVNVAGTFLICREAAKLMRSAEGGRIVNLGSVAAALDLEGEAIYAASKAAVHSLSRILAREFAALGVTVNTLAPTPVATDLIASVPQGTIKALVDRQAIKRLGEMADVQNVVDFFLSPASAFITGQIIYLGGI